MNVNECMKWTEKGHKIFENKIFLLKKFFFCVDWKPIYVSVASTMKDRYTHYSDQDGRILWCDEFPEENI